jgi:hypothetical protein
MGHRRIKLRTPITEKKRDTCWKFTSPITFLNITLQMALPAAEITMQNDDTENVDDITRSRGQGDRDESLLMVVPVHVGKDRDASDAEDDRHDL